MSAKSVALNMTVPSLLRGMFIDTNLCYRPTDNTSISSSSSSSCTRSIAVLTSLCQSLRCLVP